MKVLAKLIDLNIIDKEDNDLYEYSLNITKGYVIFIFIVLVSNFFTKNYINTAMFLLIFFALRRCCGGLHLESVSSCMVLSVFITLLIPILCMTFHLSDIKVIIIQIVVSLFLLMIPIIETPQKSLSNKEKKTYKIQSIYTIVFCLLVNICFVYMDLEGVSMVVLLTVVTSYVSVLLGYIKYKAV